MLETCDCCCHRAPTSGSSSTPTAARSATTHPHGVILSAASPFFHPPQPHCFNIHVPGVYCPGECNLNSRCHGDLATGAQTHLMMLVHRSDGPFSFSDTCVLVLLQPSNPPLSHKHHLFVFPLSLSLLVISAAA